MPGYLFVFSSGVLFAAGLALSGMTLPRRSSRSAI